MSGAEVHVHADAQPAAAAPLDLDGIEARWRRMQSLTGSLGDCTEEAFLVLSELRRLRALLAPVQEAARDLAALGRPGRFAGVFEPVVTAALATIDGEVSP